MNGKVLPLVVLLAAIVATVGGASLA